MTQAPGAGGVALVLELYVREKNLLCDGFRAQEGSLRLITCPSYFTDEETEA